MGVYQALAESIYEQAYKTDFIYKWLTKIAMPGDWGGLLTTYINDILLPIASLNDIIIMVLMTLVILWARFKTVYSCDAEIYLKYRPHPFWSPVLVIALEYPGVITVCKVISGFAILQCLLIGNPGGAFAVWAVVYGYFNSRAKLATLIKAYNPYYRLLDYLPAVSYLAFRELRHISFVIRMLQAVFFPLLVLNASDFSSGFNSAEDSYKKAQSALKMGNKADMEYFKLQGDAALSRQMNTGKRAPKGAFETNARFAEQNFKQAAFSARTRNKLNEEWFKLEGLKNIARNFNS